MQAAGLLVDERFVHASDLRDPQSAEKNLNYVPVQNFVFPKFSSPVRQRPFRLQQCPSRAALAESPSNTNANTYNPIFSRRTAFPVMQYRL